MWFREYQDYKTDEPLVKQSVEPSRGIIGCEMHEINGWGNTLHEGAWVRTSASQNQFGEELVNSGTSKNKVTGTRMDASGHK